MMPVSWKRLTLCLVATGAVAAAVSGCVPLVIGGAAVGGTVMAIDRRTAGIQVEDESIEMRVASAIRERAGNDGHINVTSYNRQVLLTGEAPNEAFKQKAEEAAKTAQNVRSVVNDVGVMFNSSLSQRSTDTLITGKVRASIIDAKDLSSSAIKVVTERNVVYLMGRVTERESKRAAEIARGVANVQKVVRVFEVISEEELKSLSNNRSTGNAAPVVNDSSASAITTQPATVVPAPAAAPAAPAAAPAAAPVSTGVTTSPVNTTPVQPLNDGFTTKP